MNGEPVEDLREFIVACGSVSQLEVLLLLRGRPDAWSSARLANELRIAPRAAATQLAALHDWGLLVAEPDDGTYRYAPRDPEMAALVERVATAYAQRRVSVIRLIYSQPAAVRQFSESFRLRRRDDDA